ncbi:MAG: DUF2442 domain-containing protein [Treponema sp.]|nr:DUF2442 domain-containing protein [Treponema sp.]
MHEENGIVHSDNPEKMLTVLEVKHMYGGIYLLKFSDNVLKLFDTSILTGEVFEPLRNPEVYENPKLEYGIVTWNNGEIDCAPEFMYENGYLYNTEDVISVA